MRVVMMSNNNIVVDWCVTISHWKAPVILTGNYLE